jgi:tRNA threonylcarbamoyladenosine biosynthesis protein TsaE
MRPISSDAPRTRRAGRVPLAGRQGMTYSAKDTRALGCHLGRRAVEGDLIACCGPIGAGKTTLIQGFAEGLEVGAEAYVRSPTFTLMHEYRGRLPLFHFDFYRLSQASEVYEIGFEEYYEAGGVVIVEWAEKFPEILPANYLELVIRIVSAQRRLIRYTIDDTSYSHYLEDSREGFEAV